MSRRRLPPIVCVIVLIAGAGVATGDRLLEVNTAAQAHVDAGAKAYAAGHYATAIREFEAAYQIDPQPPLLYAWAQVLRYGERCAEAITIYQRYLETKLNEAQVAAARSGIADCQAVRPPGGMKEPEREHSNPQSDPPTPRDRPRWYSDFAGGALVIGGTVIVAAGTGFLFAAKRADDAAQKAEFRDDFIELSDQAMMRRRIGYVGLGVGGALVIGGIIRYVTRPDTPTDLAIAATRNTVMVLGRF